MLKKHTLSFQHAFEGLSWALKTQPNYRIHLLLSAVALWGAWFFQISAMELIIIVLLITLGVVIETINTAIEETLNTVDRKWRQDIKLAKDLSAASMLVFAIGSVVISCIIFVPRMVQLLAL